MSSPPPDPRVFLAAERTLLAWVRTGIAVIGLGFVVAKFGLFAEAAGLTRPIGSSHLRSTSIGIGLVVLGGASMAHAAWQQRRLLRRLGKADLPDDYNVRFGIWFGFTVSVLSAILAIHVLLRAAEHERAAATRDGGADTRRVNSATE